MAMNFILLLVCIDGYAAAHTPNRSTNSLRPPSLHHRRRRCHGDGVVSATSTPTIAGFFSTASTSRRRHRREEHLWRYGDSMWNYHPGQHRGILHANSGSHTMHYSNDQSRFSRNPLILSTVPDDTSDNLSQSLLSKRDNDVDVDNDDANKYNWTSQTIAIAVPSLAGMMTDPLLSLADTLFVGMLGSTVALNGIGTVGKGSVTTRSTPSTSISSVGSSSVPLAALGACTSIFHLCFHCFRATTSSTSSLVAAALVRDEQRSKKTKGVENDVDNSSILLREQSSPQQNEAVLIAQTSIQQSIIMGAFITTFLLVFGPQCLHAMGVSPHHNGSGQQAQLYPSAMTYLNNRSIAAPAVVMLSASEGIFRGYGDVITPWKVSCLVSLLNLIMDPYCMFGGMYGLGMGIKGAAVATALSQVIGALAYGRQLFQRGMLGGQNPIDKAIQGDLKRQKRSIAATILRANAAMMAKQGSLLLAWAYATSRATRMGHTIVASHQMALSIWLVVALFLDGAGVAAQVLMAREWEGYKLARTMEGSDKSRTQSTTGGKRRAIKSLSLYMIKLSLIQGLVGSLAILLLQQSAPSFIFTSDPAVRQNLLTLLPHVAYQMTLVSATLVTEALAIGGGRFKWLAGGTTVSAVIAMVKLRGAKDLVGIWSGVSKHACVPFLCSSISPNLISYLPIAFCIALRSQRGLWHYLLVD